jgi:hypothetical protein
MNAELRPPPYVDVPIVKLPMKLEVPEPTVNDPAE